MENINLTKFTKDVNNIQALSDRPNTADGLTSHELKEKFDKAGVDLKDFINNTMLPEIEKIFLKCITSDDKKFSNYVLTSDSRLSNSRKCNNTFDNALTARENLKIKSGTSLPSSGTDGDLFLLY